MAAPINSTFFGDAFQFLNILYTKMLGRFVVAIVILLLGFIAGKFIGATLQRALKEIELNKIMRNATGINWSVEKLISNIVMYLIYIVVIIMALEAMQITSTVIYIILTLIVVAVITSFILAVKDYIPNMMAGFTIYRKQIVQLNDKIKVKNIEGKVTHISLTETIVKTKEGDIIFIPNASLTRKEIVYIKRINR